MIKQVLNFTLAIPSVIAVMYIISAIIFLVGPISIYSQIGSTHGLWRTFIYGTEINIFLIALSGIIVWLNEKEYIDIDYCLGYGVVQMIFALFIVALEI